MDLNHVELPPNLIADLYKKSLIEPASSSLQKEKPIEQSHFNFLWKYVGDNNKNILIIVNTKEAIHLPDNELSFLTDILGACKFSMNDVAIVNLNNHPSASYTELKSFFKSKTVLLFDVEPIVLGLPMNFPHYQVQAFSNTSFLFSPSLKELENDKLQKSKLWVCLRRLFNV